MPKQNNSSCPFDNEVRELSLVLNILLKLKINYSINRILHQKINGNEPLLPKTD